MSTTSTTTFVSTRPFSFFIHKQASKHTHTISCYLYVRHVSLGAVGMGADCSTSGSPLQASVGKDCIVTHATSSSSVVVVVDATTLTTARMERRRKRNGTMIVVKRERERCAR